MDAFKPRHNVKVVNANAKIATFFRFLEVFVFIIILSRVSTQFSFSFNLSDEHFKGILVTLISPRFVFLVGNAIVVVLFLISAGENGKESVDFYDEYVGKCRDYNNNQQRFGEEEKKEPGECEHGGGVVCYEVKEKKKEKMMMSRCESEKMMRARGKDLRRSVSEKCRKREDEMSGEEFRRTVEAFIARQQRFLREEGFSAVVTV